MTGQRFHGPIPSPSPACDLAGYRNTGIAIAYSPITGLNEAGFEVQPGSSLVDVKHGQDAASAAFRVAHGVDVHLPESRELRLGGQQKLVL